VGPAEERQRLKLLRRKLKSIQRVRRGFAFATVAYYHRFEALEAQCKSEINADDLRDTCRLVNRERLHDPLQTLQNARNLGLLHRPGRGVFSINSVGENLVAMTLPSDGN
jgi:hypothetical protein